MTDIEQLAKLAEQIEYESGCDADEAAARAGRILRAAEVTPQP